MLDEGRLPARYIHAYNGGDCEPRSKQRERVGRAVKWLHRYYESRLFNISHRCSCVFWFMVPQLIQNSLLFDIPITHKYKHVSTLVDAYKNVTNHVEPFISFLPRLLAAGL